MMADPDTINRATHLLWASHNVERIADRVTNICERVVFAVTGETEELVAGGRSVRRRAGWRNRQAVCRDSPDATPRTPRGAFERHLRGLEAVPILPLPRVHRPTPRLLRPDGRG